MIGFGQDNELDEIIFSNGDVIYGNVIEVGVNDITYRYKGETTNNISKKRDIARVIYSSGRIENFDKQHVGNDSKRSLVGKYVGLGIVCVLTHIWVFLTLGSPK
jgi:hypothetical protein